MSWKNCHFDRAFFLPSRFESHSFPTFSIRIVRQFEFSNSMHCRTHLGIQMHLRAHLTIFQFENGKKSNLCQNNREMQYCHLNYSIQIVSMQTMKPVSIPLLFYTNRKQFAVCARARVVSLSLYFFSLSFRLLSSPLFIHLHFARKKSCFAIFQSFSIDVVWLLLLLLRSFFSFVCCCFVVFVVCWVLYNLLKWRQLVFTIYISIPVRRECTAEPIRAKPLKCIALSSHI